jgi:hypothetical protein
VENIIGAGVFKSEEKSCGGRGVSGLSVVGEEGSERVEETERRFVRAGVRAGRAGGPLEEELVLLVWNVGRMGVPTGSASSARELVVSSS